MKARAIEIRGTETDDRKLTPLVRMIVEYYEKHPEEKAKVDAMIAENERETPPSA